MSIRMLQIDGRKFRIVPEEEYKRLHAAYQWRQKRMKDAAADLAEAERRIKDPKRKSIPLARLKAELGL